MPIVEVNQVSKRYGKDKLALNDVSLTLESGMFGLLGPNGAGKTTLMRILAGILAPTNGSVSVMGHDLSTPVGRQAAKAHLGYLPQYVTMYDRLSAREFLGFIARLKHLDNVNTEIERVLEIVNLTTDSHKKIGTYSGGMKRRVGIAQALLGRPDFIIVDEPTTGLDPEERLRVRNTLSDMALDSTILLSTHIIDDISQSCRTVAIINEGEILFCGSPQMLIKDVTGKAGVVTRQAGQPPSHLKVVSTRQLADGTQYRVLGSQLPDDAEPIQPTLEDAYLWVMQQTTGNP
jgi:ABC-type multidrug transport system ATPase subunit